MTKSKWTLITGVVATFAAVILLADLGTEQKPFQSVELNLAEVSPLGESAGYAVPASGETVRVYVPKALISDNVNWTFRNETYRVTYSPKKAGSADSCYLESKAPGSNTWKEIDVAGAGNTRNIAQSPATLGTWKYRARCAIKVNICTATQVFNEHTYFKSLKASGLFSLNFETPHAEAGGGGKDPKCKKNFYGDWVYLNHNVVPQPPIAEIVQSKATTDRGEAFRVSYGPKRTGYAGGVADACVLQRLAPSQTTWVNVDTSAGRTNNVEQMFNTLGTYKYRAKCSNDGGDSAWVGITHEVVPQPPRAEISQNMASTDRGEAFRVSYGPKQTGYAGGIADACLLQRLAPSQAVWVNVDTSAGRTNNVAQTLNILGTWQYRAKCSNDGGDSAFVSINHEVIPQPPKAEISQNKATTDKGESFIVTYGPKRTGYAGGVADSCVLQRLAPSQTAWVNVETSAGNTKNVSQMFNTVGTYRYRAQCTNDGGSSAWVSLNHIVVTDGTVPTVILEVRNTTADDAWTSENISINTGDQISLHWEGTNVSTCTGSAFTTGGAVSGTNANVTEPTANSSRTYTVNCTGTNGAVSDSLTVSMGVVGGTGDVDVDPDIVRKGDPVDVTWTGASGACTLTGPGVNMTNLGPSGSVEVVINGESTYTLICPGGQDTATVKVLPVIQET